MLITTLSASASRLAPRNISDDRIYPGSATHSSSTSSAVSSVICQLANLPVCPSLQGICKASATQPAVGLGRRPGYPARCTMNGDVQAGSGKFSASCVLFARINFRVELQGCYGGTPWHKQARWILVQSIDLLGTGEGRRSRGVATFHLSGPMHHGQQMRRACRQCAYRTWSRR